MLRIAIIILVNLFFTVCYSQKFFSWPIYENQIAENRGCSDTIYLKDSRPVLRYSKYNCSSIEIANSISIGLFKSGVINFCVIPLEGEILKNRNGLVLEISMFYSYLNFNIWDSRLDWQLFNNKTPEINKFDFITKSNSEKNNWGHKSGQKALRNSFDAAIIQLGQQLKTLQ